jgi:hypothetical protein
MVSQAVLGTARPIRRYSPIAMGGGSPKQIVWVFIGDHDGEFKKSDIQKAMSGRGVPVRRIPIFVEDLIKNGFAILEGRQVQEGDRKVTRNFVSVAPFLRDLSPDDRDMWWEGQTQTKSQRAH